MRNLSSTLRATLALTALSVTLATGAAAAPLSLERLAPMADVKPPPGKGGGCTVPVGSTGAGAAWLLGALALVAVGRRRG